MPIKTILVYLPSNRNAASILEPVLRIAGPRGAHVIGLHLTADLPIYGEFPAEVSSEVMERLQKVGSDTAAAAKKSFEDAFKSSDVSHEWRAFTASYGAGADLIASQGSTADLIVCGKAAGDVPDAWDDFAETAVLRSGRPVLIVPSSHTAGQIGKHAVIAWNGTREAVRAVFDSLDLIRDAETVRAVTFIDQESQRLAAKAQAAALGETLQRHGIRVSCDVAFADNTHTGDAILSALVDEGCDLLIMGAYSHSRFREMIFGGVSRDILRDSWVPILVSH